MIQDARLLRLVSLIQLALRPPPGRSRIFLALCVGVTCHVLFAAAVIAMMIAMFLASAEAMARSRGLGLAYQILH